MHFVAKKSDLINVLKEVRNCVKPNTSSIIEITSSVYFEVKENLIKIKATNYNMFVEDKFKPVNVNQTGNVIVPFSVLNSLIKQFPSENISIKIKDNELILYDNNKKYKIPIIDSEFPEPYLVEEDVSIKIKESILKEIFKRFIKVIPDDSHKREFTGLNINVDNEKKIDFVATDTYRMYMYSHVPSNIIGDTNVSFIVPKDMIKYLNSIFEYNEDFVILTLNFNYIQITKGDLTVKHQLINGSYPDYKAIIPNNLTHTINIETSALKNSLSRIKTISDFSIGDNLVYFKGENNDTLYLLTSDGKNIENLNVNLPTQIGMNMDYNQILDFVSTADNQSVKLAYNIDNKLSPVVFSDEKVQYMMLPVR